MADHDCVGPHGIQCDRGVDQRLALLHRALRGMHIHHVRPKPLASNLKAEKRTRRILEECIDDGEAIQ